VRIEWSCCVACGGRCLTERRSSARNDDRFSALAIVSRSIQVNSTQPNTTELNSTQLKLTLRSMPTAVLAAVSLSLSLRMCVLLLLDLCGWASIVAASWEKKLETTTTATTIKTKMEDGRHNNGWRLTVDGWRLRGAWAATSVAEQFSKATIRPAVCASAFIAIFRTGSAAASLPANEWVTFPLGRELPLLVNASTQAESERERVPATATEQEGESA